MKNYIHSVCFIMLACSTPTAPLEIQVETTEKPSKPSDVNSAPSISIRLTQNDLIFRYMDKGAIKLVTSLNDVPEANRHAIYVDDLSVSPALRQSERYLQRYDLSQPPGSEGSYQGTPVLRTEVEAQIVRMRPKPKAKASSREATPSTKALQKAKVVLYSTKSCGYCRKARAFLAKNKVPFKERDIEKSPAARKELEIKAQRAGVRVNGVPVLDVNGQIIPGYNPQAILKALDS
jgi:glutaredoxin